MKKYNEQKKNINEAIEFIIQDLNEIINEKDKRIEELELLCNELRIENETLKGKHTNESLDTSELIDAFEKGSKKRTKKIIKKYIADEEEYNKISQLDKLAVLFIAYLYNLDDEVLKRYDVFKETPSYKELHKLYYLCKADMKKAFDGEMHDECLGRYIADNRNMIQINEKIIEEISAQNYKYLENVELIKNGNYEVCEVHKVLLQDKRVFIDCVDENNKHKVQGVSLKYCYECNKGYILENHTVSSSNYKELNDRSELNKFGYIIKENRENRLRILKYKAVPELGKQYVVNHINWLIRFNGNRKGMEDAVHEWKYDLQAVKDL